LEQEIRPMMGERRVMQEALFYGFSLERHVPEDHLLRKIDRFVDLSEVRAHLGPYYSDVGRPSIDPELMIRMLIVGYGLGIRSERRLCEEVHLNLAYRWFCRLGLDGDVPDHSTFCHVVRNGATEAVLNLRCWKWRDQKGLESRICCKYENVGWASASSLIFTASNRMLSLPLQARSMPL
jgi:transposase